MDEETDFSRWVGSRETAADDVTAASVAGMTATLDRDDPAPAEGDILPPLWHWMYFAPRRRQSELGPDGHPARGGFVPPIPLPRRMFAGGRLTFHAPLRVGQRASREGEIIGVERKDGRSGPLVFVTIRYRIFADGDLAIEEENDIVYRDAQAQAQVPARESADLAALPWRREITPDPVMLFRYSALTFNGHRIHYDQPYVTSVEGYPGLIVHGPLIATLMMELGREHMAGQTARSFEFRAKRPLFDTAPFTVAGRPGENACDLWTIDPEGAVAMTARATFAQG